MSWEYNREEQQFELIPEGVHRIRVRSAEKAVSKSGRDMLVLQFDVSGYSSILYHYIVFLEDRPEITNRTLTQFFDSFADIKEGDFNLNNWIGKIGACSVKHEEYNGNMQAKLHYYINKDKQADLPPWKEKGDNNTPVVGGNGFTDAINVPDEKMPF